MSNKSTLLAAVNAMDEAACGAAMELLGIPQVENGHDTPDAQGLVAFTGLRAGHPRASFRFYVKDVVDALPDGHAKDLGVANLRYMNALNMIESVQDWGPLSGVVGTGANARIDGRSPTIPNALVFAAKDARTDAPLFDTVQKATDFLNSKPDSAFGVQSGDGFHA